MADITLDAGVLIALANRVDAHHSWAQDLFATHASTPMNTPVLTLAETLVGPIRAGHGRTAMRLFTKLNIDVLTLDPGDAAELASLRAESNLRMPDAVVLHAAISRSAALATTDRKLAQAARQAGLETHSPW